MLLLFRPVAFQLVVVTMNTIHHVVAERVDIAVEEAIRLHYHRSEDHIAGLGVGPEQPKDRVVDLAPDCPRGVRPGHCRRQPVDLYRLVARLDGQLDQGRYRFRLRLGHLVEPFTPLPPVEPLPHVPVRLVADPLVAVHPSAPVRRLPVNDRRVPARKGRHLQRAAPERRLLARDHEGQAFARPHAGFGLHVCDAVARGPGVLAVQHEAAPQAEGQRLHGQRPVGQQRVPSPQPPAGGTSGAIRGRRRPLLLLLLL